MLPPAALPIQPALAHEVLVDVSGCAPEALADPEAMRGLADAMVSLLGVSVLLPPQLHRFEDSQFGPGGVTGLYLLSESHLALHSWPERGVLLLSICCCRPLPQDDDLARLLRDQLGAVHIRLRRLLRDAP